MSLSFEVALERHLNFNGSGDSIHECGQKDHENFVIFVEIVPPNTLTETLQEVSVFSLKYHYLLVIIKDLHRMILGFSEVLPNFIKLFLPVIHNETHVLIRSVI